MQTFDTAIRRRLGRKHGGDEAFAYLEEITPDSDWYVSALALKADLYQLEGLTDVAREKLLEALNYSDDALLVFGLAELDSELGNYQEAIQGYAQLGQPLYLRTNGRINLPTNRLRICSVRQV